MKGFAATCGTGSLPEMRGLAPPIADRRPRLPSRGTVSCSVFPRRFRAARRRAGSDFCGLILCQAQRYFNLRCKTVMSSRSGTFALEFVTRRKIESGSAGTQYGLRKGRFDDLALPVGGMSPAQDCRQRREGKAPRPSSRSVLEAGLQRVGRRTFSFSLPAGSYGRCGR